MRYAPANTTLLVRAYRIRPMPKIISAAIPNARSSDRHPRFAAKNHIPSSGLSPAPRFPRIRTLSRWLAIASPPATDMQPLGSFQGYGGTAQTHTHPSPRTMTARTPSSCPFSATLTKSRSTAWRSTTAGAAWCSAPRRSPSAGTAPTRWTASTQWFYTTSPAATNPKQRREPSP